MRMGRFRLREVGPKLSLPQLALPFKNPRTSKLVSVYIDPKAA